MKFQSLNTVSEYANGPSSQESHHGSLMLAGTSRSGSSPPPLCVPRLSSGRAGLHTVIRRGGGAGLRSPSSQLCRVGSFSTASNWTFGRRRATLGPSASSGLAPTPSPNSWGSALASFQRSQAVGNSVSRVPTVIVNTSSTSPYSRKVAMLMPCGASCSSQQKKSLPSSTHCGRRSSLIENARQRKVATNLVSLSATNHIQLDPRSHAAPTRSVPPHRPVQVWLWASFECSAASKSQTYRCVCLMQETSNTTFASTNTVLDQTVLVWITGAGCGVNERQHAL